MQNILKHSVLACLLVICAAYCRAELTGHTHDFHEMRGVSPTLLWTKSPDYTYGAATIPPVLAYQGANGGTFANASGTIVFQLPSNGSTMETLSAVEDLTKIEILCVSSVDAYLEFYISSDDGAHWTQVTEGITTISYSTKVPMPAKGNYRIKIKRTTNSPINILSVTYYTDPCNCLRVVTE